MCTYIISHHLLLLLIIVFYIQFEPLPVVLVVLPDADLRSARVRCCSGSEYTTEAHTHVLKGSYRWLPVPPRNHINMTESQSVSQKCTSKGV